MKKQHDSEVLTADEPLYASIAALGGYSVTFRKRRTAMGNCVSGSHSGSSETLLQAYAGSGIPCIDYRPADFSKVPCICGVREASNSFSTSNMKDYPTLSEYIEMCRKAGAIISTL